MLGHASSGSCESLSAVVRSAGYGLFEVSAQLGGVEQFGVVGVLIAD